MNFFNRFRNPKRFKPNFGNLRTTRPISKNFGYERGLPIDRYYIENFLLDNSAFIRGNAIEVGDNTYTLKFGSEHLEAADSIHISDPNATYVTDLANDTQLPENYYDCAIITQTLHFIYDYQSAMNKLYDILKPGGVLLLTTPGISQLSNDLWKEMWYWSFTKASLKEIATSSGFEEHNYLIENHGNVLTSSAFLYGLCTTDLTKKELDYKDEQFQQIITLLARK